MTATPVLVVTGTPETADHDAVMAVLRAYNEAHVGPSARQALAVLIKDQAGATVGGLWGFTSRGWLHVEMLAIPDALRGQGLGSRLMAAAEAEALARGCDAAWLDTFQARGFYEKLGYRVFGTLDHYPRGHQRFFLTKPLTPSAATER